MMFWASLLIASSTAAATLSPSAPTDGLLAIAEGVNELSRSKPEAATLAFRKAIRFTPNSAIAYHHLGISLAQQKLYAEALKALSRAYELGSRSIEAQELKAIILARQGRFAEARVEARLTESFNGHLIGVSLDDPESTKSVAHHLQERSTRGLLVAATLATAAGQRGQKVQAINLLQVAEDYGHELLRAEWADTVRALKFRLHQEIGTFTTEGRIGTSFDYVKNPLFRAAGESEVRSALRLSMTAEASLAITLDTLRIDTALFALNRVYLAERDVLRPVELNGLAWSSAVMVPLNDRPDAARVGVHVRLRDLYARSADIHYANSIEGGPVLQLPFASQARLGLGIFGVATDFVDKSPPDDVVSSQNRDFVGQRALIDLLWWVDIFKGQLSASFFRNDARGEAFDMNGGSVSGQIMTDLTGGLFLRTGAGVGLRRFGPVGDAAILGSAAIRTEIRLYGDLAVLVHLTPWLQLELENTFLQNAGRSGHAYTDNILSVGAEVHY